MNALKGSCGGYWKLNALRWPLQTSASVGLAFILLVLLPPSEKFIGTGALIGPIMCVLAIEVAAGSSLRRAWTLAVGGMIGSLLGVALLSVLAVKNRKLDLWTDRALVHVFSMLLCVPAALAKDLFPSHSYAGSFGLTTSQTVLLSGYSGRDKSSLVNYGLKRSIASIVGGLCALVSSQVIFPNKARPAILNDLRSIFSTLAQIVSSAAISMQESRAQDEETILVIQSLQQCSTLLDKQSTLLDYARDELSFKKPHAFPRHEYIPVLEKTRQLFYHIASLTLAAHLDFVTEDVAHQEPETLRENLSLVEKTITTIKGGKRKHKVYKMSKVTDTELVQKETSQRRSSLTRLSTAAAQKETARPQPLAELHNKRKLPSIAERGAGTQFPSIAQVRGESRRTSTAGESDASRLSSISEAGAGGLRLPSIAEVSLPPDGPLSRLAPSSNFLSFGSFTPFASRLSSTTFPRVSPVISGTPSFQLGSSAQFPLGVAPSFGLPVSVGLPVPAGTRKGMETALKSAELSVVSYHVARCLDAVRQILGVRNPEARRTAREHLIEATLINEKLGEKRDRQREMYSRIIKTTFQANSLQNWFLPRDSPFLDWVAAIDIEPAQFLALPSKEKLAHWQSYWLRRDRVSGATTTLTTIIGILYNLLELIHIFNEELDPSDKQYSWLCKKTTNV